MLVKKILSKCCSIVIISICLFLFGCVSTQDRINQAVIKNDAGTINNYLANDLDPHNIRFGLYASIKYDRPALVKIFAAHVNSQVKGIYIGKAGTLGKQHMIRLLLELGADINAKDTNGNTPLMVAARGYVKDPREESKLYMDKHQYRIIKYLIDNGADVKAKNNKGETALMIAKKDWAGQENGYLIMGRLKESGLK